MCMHMLCVCVCVCVCVWLCVSVCVCVWLHGACAGSGCDHAARGGEGGAAASGHPIATLGARRRVRRTQTLGIAPGHDLVAMADAQLE
jgi:hypothetical protein